MYLAVYQITINSISGEFAISSTISGLLISLHFAGIMIAPAIFGEISDRIGKKPVIIMSFIILISGLLLVYFFNILVLIATGILLIGCGFGVIEGVMSGLLADINSERTNQVINISQMYFSIGAVLGPITALWITEIFGGWKQNYIVLALLFLILLFIIARQKHKKINSEGGILENTISGSPISKGPISMMLLKERMLILLCISIFIYVGIEESAAFWTNTYFHDVLNTEKLGAYALSGYWGSMIIGRYLGSRFEEKGNIFSSVGLFISFVSLILALIVKSPVFNLVCFVLLGFGFSVVWPVLMATAAKSYPKYTGTTMGIMMMFGAAGGIIVPFITGAVGELAGIAGALWIIPIFILLIILLQKKLKDLK